MVNKNSGIQNRGWFNINIQRYGLTGKQIKQIAKELDKVYANLKTEIESSRIKMTESVEQTVRGVVADCALSLILHIDDSARQSEESIKEATQNNINNLAETLLSQLKTAFAILAVQAKKDKQDIITALEKWKNESMYYADLAMDAFVAAQITCGAIQDQLADGMNWMQYGRKLLHDAMFSDAIERFEKATNKNPKLTAEACFYMALARCRIQPVWDMYKGVRVPLIYDIHSAKLKNDTYYDQAVSTEKDESKKAYYIDFAEQVDDILLEYDRIESANKDGLYDFDCFICIKKSEIGSEQDTDDFKWLEKSGLFERLGKAGIKTFLADERLKDSRLANEGSNDYNAFITYALQKAKVLLLVCSKSEYAQTKWVKNEYTRFIGFHKRPEIVLVSDNPNVKINGIENRIQAYSRDDMDKIIACVKSKAEEAKGYVDSECYYCEKCGTKHSRKYSFCPETINGEECGGKLLTAVEYSNRINAKNHEELRRQKNLLRQKEEQQQQMEAELARLRQENEALKKAQNRPKPAPTQTDYPTLENYDESVFEIEGTVLKKCIWWIKSCRIPAGVTEIGALAFDGCKDLESVEIPDGVQSIGINAFRDCSSLSSIDIPSSVANIGELPLGAGFLLSSSFSGCNSLASITVRKGTGRYHSSGNCLIETATKKLVLGCKNSVIPTDGSVTSIGDNAFDDCIGLTNIEIPKSVTHIGSHAFSGCAGLTSLEIPKSVTSIGEGVVARCVSLASIAVEKGNKEYYSEGNCLIEKKGKKLIAGCKNSVIPTDGSVTSIGTGAFSGCSGLTNIEIPNSVTSIGDRAFSGCISLTNIEIPNSVERIGDFAFSECCSLTSIKFGGTKKEWLAILNNWWLRRYSDINWQTGEYKVTCSDGVLTKNERF